MNESKNIEIIHRKKLTQNVSNGSFTTTNTTERRIENIFWVPSRLNKKKIGIPGANISDLLKP